MLDFIPKKIYIDLINWHPLKLKGDFLLMGWQALLSWYPFQIPFRKLSVFQYYSEESFKQFKVNLNFRKVNKPKCCYQSWFPNFFFFLVGPSYVFHSRSSTEEAFPGMGKTMMEKLWRTDVVKDTGGYLEKKVAALTLLNKHTVMWFRLR